MSIILLFDEATANYTYEVSIAGLDRTGDILNATISIDDNVNDVANTLSLKMIDRSGQGVPQTDDEITVQLADTTGTRIFGGVIVKESRKTKGIGAVEISIQAVDYTRLLDQVLVHKSYEDMTDKAIIEDIVATYCAGSGITTTNVAVGATINQIVFNYVQVSQAIKKLAKITNRYWYIDYNKDIHYFTANSEVAPFNITDTSSDYFDLRISKDSTQLKNRIYVRGGTKLSDQTQYDEKGDGEKRIFVLPEKPHEVTVQVNGVTETLGIKNIDTSGYDWYLNFQEKYIEQDSGGAVLTDTDTLTVFYSYDVPVLVAIEDGDSIIENGVHEFAIFDNTIRTTQAARDRAIAELVDYKNDVIEGAFSTYEPGFVSGQTININRSDYGVNDDYIIQSVKLQSLGGGMYKYNITLASSKTMGILRFLINLLEQNRNQVTLDTDEVVDELFTLNDSLLADSLLDSLVIDSAPPYATWSFTGDTSPTRARWNLFQWKG